MIGTAQCIGGGPVASTAAAAATGGLLASSPPDEIDRLLSDYTWRWFGDGDHVVEGVGGIATMTDRVAAINAGQATTTWRPQLSTMNGRGALDLDGTDDYLYTTGGIVLTNFYAFVVAQPDTVNGVLVEHNEADTPRSYLYTANPGSWIRRGTDINQVNWAAGAPARLGARHVYTQHYKRGVTLPTNTIHLESTLATVAEGAPNPSDNPTASDIISIGGRGSGAAVQFPINGLIAFVAIADDSALDAAAVTDIQTTLATVYGV